MKRFNWKIWLIVPPVVAILLVSLHFTRAKLESLTREENLRFTGDVVNAPPLVTFATVALGSFRGVAADLLWLRCTSLQEKRSFFEMAQLSRWITDLQPNFSASTVYLAWNMAYNISVSCSDFSERWKWVNEGIKLLRDRALLYNPEDAKLYRELAWIYHHKLGNILDDAHQYYKNQLAMQMMRIFGGTPDWEAMAAAPLNSADFVARYPADSAVMTAIKNAGYADVGALERDFNSSAPNLPEKLQSVLANDPATANLILHYLRAKLLRDECRLEARKIFAINRKYGELDWRVPESQAIYWAVKGEKHATGFLKLECDRQISQALYDSFRYGKILMLNDKDFENLQLVPNLQLADAVYATFVEAQEKNEGKDNPYSSFRSARIYFLKEAVVIFYNFGKFRKAEEYFQKLVAEDGPQPQKTAEAFAMAELAERIVDAGVKEANETIGGLIFRGVGFMLYGEIDAAVASERMARYIHRAYMRTTGKEKRMALPDYAEMKKNIVEGYLLNLPPELARRLRENIAREQATEREEREFQRRQMLKK